MSLILLQSLPNVPIPPPLTSDGPESWAMWILGSGVFVVFGALGLWVRESIRRSREESNAQMESARRRDAAIETLAIGVPKAVEAAIDRCDERNREERTSLYAMLERNQAACASRRTPPTANGRDTDHDHQS